MDSGEIKVENPAVPDCPVACTLLLLIRVADPRSCLRSSTSRSGAPRSRWVTSHCLYAIFLAHHLHYRYVSCREGKGPTDDHRPLALHGHRPPATVAMWPVVAILLTQGRQRGVSVPRTGKAVGTIPAAGLQRAGRWLGERRARITAPSRRGAVCHGYAKVRGW